MSAIIVRLFETWGQQIGGGIIFDDLDTAKAYAERRLGTGEPKRVASALIYQDGRQILSLNRSRQWQEARP